LDYRHTQINSLGGEWKIVGQLGESLGAFSEFYQPLDPENYFFVAPQIMYQKSFQDIYEGDDRIAQYEQNEWGGGFDLGANLRSYLETRVGLRSSMVSAQPEIGGTTLPEFENTQKTGLLGQIDFDQLDDHRFPTRGIKAASRFFVSEESLGSDQSYRKIDFNLGKATTVKDRHTFLAFLQGGISLSDKTPYYDKYTAGGFLNLSGLSPGQLRGKNVGTGKLVYYYKLLDTKGLASKVYLGGSLEAGNVWEDKADFGEDLILGGSSFVGLDTVLGPLYIGYGQADGYSGRAFVYLGKTF
jgi:NTE family protein